MREGNIDAAQQDPKNYAKVWSEAGGENRELVVESVQTTWKSYYQNIADVLNKGEELVVKPEEIRKTDAGLRCSDAVFRDRRNRANLVGAIFHRKPYQHKNAKLFRLWTIAFIF